MSQEQQEREAHRLFVANVYQLVSHMPGHATAQEWARLFQPVLEMASDLLGDEETIRLEQEGPWHDEPVMLTDPAAIPTWIRAGDERIGKRARARDSLGNPIAGKITAIVKWSSGREQIELVEGTRRTGTTTVWADPATVHIL
jgi:hypothetical protein